MGTMSATDKVGITLLVTCFVFLQAQLWLSKGSVPELYSLHFQTEKQLQENKMLEHRNKLLALEIADLKKGTQGIEEMARGKLGMIRKGESYYMIIDRTN